MSRVGCGPRRGERGKGAGQAGLRPGFQGAASSFLFFSVISKPFLNQFENHFKVSWNYFEIWDQITQQTKDEFSSMNAHSGY